jgi:hypothetical protein
MFGVGETATTTAEPSRRRRIIALAIVVALLALVLLVWFLSASGNRVDCLVDGSPVICRPQ